MFTGKSKTETLWTSNKQASTEHLKSVSGQLMMKFMLQLHGPRICLERKCGREQVLLNIKMIKPGRPIKLRFLNEMNSVAGDAL